MRLSLMTAFLLCLASPALASPESWPKSWHERAVVAIDHDLTGLLSDTVNEGEIWAEVAKLPDGRPAIGCEAARDELLCTVQFKMRFEDKHWEAECTLSYQIDPSSLQVTRIDDEKVTTCLENLQTLD